MTQAPKEPTEELVRKSAAPEQTPATSRRQTPIDKQTPTTYFAKIGQRGRLFQVDDKEGDSRSTCDPNLTGMSVNYRSLFYYMWRVCTPCHRTQIVCCMEVHVLNPPTDRVPTKRSSKEELQSTYFLERTKLRMPTYP